MKKLVDKIKKNAHSWIATVIGVLVAITMAWQTVDWDTFNFKRDWIKLLMSAIPAIGGYMTQLKKKPEDTPE